MTSSRHAVWSQRSNSGLLHQVFVMYHATNVQAAEQILTEGEFRPSHSSDNMLGAGVYVSHTYQKALNHARAHVMGDAVILKLLVYVGKVYPVTSADDPNMKSWHRDYDSAWVPPDANRDMVPSGLQENCVKSPKQVEILGVSKGWHRLSKEARRLVNNTGEPSTRGTDNVECMEEDAIESKRDPHFRAHLRDLLRRLALQPFALMNRNHRSCNLLIDTGQEGAASLGHSREADRPHQLWVRGWKGTIENFGTGRLLTCDQDGNVYVGSSTQDAKDLSLRRMQKWKMSKAGKLFSEHKQRLSLRIFGTPQVRTAFLTDDSQKASKFEMVFDDYYARWG